MRDGGTARRRRLLIVPIVAAHGALLAMVALAPAVRPGKPEARTLSLFDIATPAEAAVPAVAAPAEAPVLPRPQTITLDLPILNIPAPMVLVAPAPPVLASAQPGMGANGTPCDLAMAVQVALHDDAGAASAIAAVPSADRSVANAIMLWDGSWTADARLLAVRARITGTVAAARAECRDEGQAGPRLIAFAPGASTTMLVLGSGRWRWADLITNDRAIAGFAAATPATFTNTDLGREAARGATLPNRRVHI